MTYRSVTELKPYPGNARTHSEAQLARLKAGIAHFGFLSPVMIDETSTIMAGHARVEAAKQLGLRKVPCILVSDLTEAEKRAYIIADNKLAELAGWDERALASELHFLFEADIDFSPELTGFDTAEIDFLLELPTADEELDRADMVDPVDRKEPAVTVLGDLWELGKHRILCADAREEASFTRLLGREKAQMAFTDPPYNVPIQGHVSGLGAARHREFEMASGEMSSSAFTSFLTRIFQNMAAFSRDGSVHDICMDWRHLPEMFAAGQAVFGELLNLCVWNKDNGGMGSLYRSKHELVGIWKAGRGPHINNVQLGRHGRYRTNVWDYRGVNSFGRDRDAALAMHPTVKPVALVADAIRDCSKRGGIILDPFAGSGTTIIAAERTGRRAAAIEIDSHYVDTAIRRWQEATQGTAIHRDTGLSFAETRDRKASVDKGAT